MHASVESRVVPIWSPERLPPRLFVLLLHLSPPFDSDRGDLPRHCRLQRRMPITQLHGCTGELFTRTFLLGTPLHDALPVWDKLQQYLVYILWSAAQLREWVGRASTRLKASCEVPLDREKRWRRGHVMGGTRWALDPGARVRVQFRLEAPALLLSKSTIPTSLSPTPTPPPWLLLSSSTSPSTSLEMGHLVSYARSEGKQTVS